MSMMSTKEEYEDMCKARVEYAKKFGERAPSIGFQIKCTPKEYAEVLRDAIQKGKPLKTKPPRDGAVY